MAKNHFVLVLGFATILLATSCNEEEIQISEGDYAILTNTLNIPEVYFNYEGLTLPDHLDNNDIQDEDNTPNNNEVTNSGATLGRVLFYDKNLSINNTVSCASCHLQDKGFADPEVFSTGFDGRLTGRNSMGIANAKFYDNGNFFWDERANTLEDQVLMPIQDHIEMGMSLEELVPKLQALDYYQILFNQVFEEETVTEEYISEALAQFVRSIVSFESKYDDGLAQVNGRIRPDTNIPGLTDEENSGRRLFGQNGCLNCHQTDLFVGDQARNNGLDAVLTDIGLGNVTGNANDNGKFKVPSLRNIELTAPYMHDGRFATLEEVVEHYNSGVQMSVTLDNRLRAQGQNQARRLNLTETEKSDLVAFLKTLTDTNLASAEHYSSPFRD
jgi:cytochrome c peroxidase